MGRFFKVGFACIALPMCMGLTACGSSKKHTDDDPMPFEPPNSQDGTKNEEPDAVVPVAVGEIASIKGDVLADDDGQFSLTRQFSFSLAAPQKLQIRKDYSNGNCGTETVTFFVVQGETQVADVTIDRNKEYEGIPIERFAAPLAAGDYQLVAYVAMPNECKNMSYYYDFFLEEAE